MFDMAAAPGRCYVDDAPQSIRLHLVARAEFYIDLCHPCLQRHAFMCADSPPALTLLVRAAKAARRGVWRAGPKHYLLREAALSRGARRRGGSKAGPGHAWIAAESGPRERVWWLRR